MAPPSGDNQRARPPGGLGFRIIIRPPGGASRSRPFSHCFSRCSATWRSSCGTFAAAAPPVGHFSVGFRASPKVGGPPGCVPAGPAGGASVEKQIVGLRTATDGAADAGARTGTLR